jgi:protein-S-isoprenylcysteine O-methyltransferase Ste14
MRATGRLLRLLLLLAVCVFLPAGTLDYWEGWLFSVVFAACSVAVTLHLAVNDPRLLERRMQIGPAATERSQKIIIVAVLLVLAATPAVSATDHRLGWSSAPSVVVVLVTWRSYLPTSASVSCSGPTPTVLQQFRLPKARIVISTGPYAVIRHPMYAWNLPMLLGDSTGPGFMVGTLMVVPMIAALVARILNEERYLAINLAGYADYRHEVPTGWSRLFGETDRHPGVGGTRSARRAKIDLAVLGLGW